MREADTLSIIHHPSSSNTQSICQSSSLSDRHNPFSSSGYSSSLVCTNHLWFISDDKRHGLKEVASLDLVIEGTGKKGIDVSISVSPFPPPLLPHISTAISRVHTKTLYADLVAKHVLALICQFYHPQRYLKVTRPLGVDYIGEIEIEVGKSIHGELDPVAYTTKIARAPDHQTLHDANRDE